ncbi:MAG: histone deacetylase [Planctomycetes bacterium]|nr:histone deacetylase [Planctomycetota bacterium]
MTLLYSRPCFLNHETGPHPESADRIRQIPGRLEQAGLMEKCTRPKWEIATPKRMRPIHTTGYASQVWALAKSGGGFLDGDTIVSPASYEVALQAVGAVCDATERIVRGEDTRALCLVRPPGHHALVNQGMGFCLFNNVAVGAKVAVEELHLDHVLIVDWDVHHGNGTQAAFWTNARVGFLSIHRWPFYPGTGGKDETGEGPAAGTTLNVPVPMGISRKEYHDAFRGALEKMAARMRPQMIFISAGFDSHRLDPVGSLGLETEDFATLTRAVLDVAAVHAEGRVASVLEGGYNPDIMADCVETHLGELIGDS